MTCLLLGYSLAASLKFVILSRSPWHCYCFPLTSLLDRQVAGKCGDSGIADTHWAACLVAEDEEGKVCPHNFLRLEDDLGCSPYGSRTPPYKKRVCCLMGPVLDLKVNKICCRQFFRFSVFQAHYE